MMSDDSQGSMGLLREMARLVRDRVGDKPGFDCILSVIPYETLVELHADYGGSVFLTAEEHSRQVIDYLRESEAREALTKTVLDTSLSSDHGPSRLLAERILRRTADNSARPLFYAAPSNEGLIVALAVHDDFWTPDW